MEMGSVVIDLTDVDTTNRQGYYIFHNSCFTCMYISVDCLTLMNNEQV